jgi:hypothetical protein
VTFFFTTENTVSTVGARDALAKSTEKRGCSRVGWDVGATLERRLQPASVLFTVVTVVNTPL